MKFTSIVLSSVLALCAAVNGKAIDEQKIKTVSTSIDEIEQLKPIEPIIIDPIIVPCPLGYGILVPQIRKCQALNGKIYQKFNPYPKCNADYVCFIPATEDDNIKSCITIEGKIYCSAKFTNIKACQKENKEYDFRQCVYEADELFTDFKYSFVTKPTIMPPPPTKTKTRITLNPTIITKPTRTIIRPTSIIRPTLTFVPITDPIDLPIKTRIISEPIPTIEPFPTAIPVPTVRPTLYPMIKEDKRE